MGKDVGMRDLRGANAILTGASRGLGVLIGEALAVRGVNLVLAARSASSLDRVADELASYGGKVTSVPTDLSDPGQLEALAERAHKELGGIDILVNNAGIEASHPYEDYPPEEIVRLIEVNLTAPMLLTRKVLPAMLEARRGHIVNIASLAGKASLPYQAPYATTKAALVMFTHTLRAELVDTGVGCSVVCPGFVADEGMYADMQRSTGVSVPGFLAVSKPSKVAEAVIKAIKQNSAELIVNPTPMRGVIAMSQLFPDVAPRIMKMIGVTSMARRAAGRRDASEAERG